MDWTDVAALDAIDDGRGVVRTVDGTTLAIMRDGDTASALANQCAHRSGHLGDGSVENGRVICTGVVRTPDDVGKALAMGADAVAPASASLIAAGCQHDRACGSDACPVGIATQDPRLRARLDVSTSATRVETFLKGTAAQVVDDARLCGRHARADLCADDLLAQNPDLATRPGIPSALPGSPRVGRTHLRAVMTSSADARRSVRRNARHCEARSRHDCC